MVAELGEEAQRVADQFPAVAEAGHTASREGRGGRLQRLRNVSSYGLDGHFSPAASLLTYGGVERSSQLSTMYRPDSWWNQ